jgi:hypothetical protein
MDLISFSTTANSLFLSAPRWMTMSISLAPFSRDSTVSLALTAGVWAPKGKPTTVPTFTREVLKASEARET